MGSFREKLEIQICQVKWGELNLPKSEWDAGERN